MEQEVLKAVKLLGEYCEDRDCSKCLFYAKDSNDACLFHYNNPYSMGKKVKTEVQTVEVYRLEDK